MTKVYRGIGVACMYPENWELTEDIESEKVVGFTLQSPNTAFMSIYSYPWTVAPKEAIEQARSALEAEYDEVEFEPIETGLDLGKGVLDDTRAGEMRFYYQEMLGAAKLIAFSTDQFTYLVQFQAEDREYEQLERVLDAMVASIVQSLKASNVSS